MLSITLLPAVYSALMNVQGEIVFRTLYPFIFCLVPLTLYRIWEKLFGKLIGLLSALFFVFTSSAFYGVTGIARQITGNLFLLLSVFLIINKTLPVTKRRLLLVIFGAALAVSHYALACIYLVIVAFVFIVSKAKNRFDGTLNTTTTVFLFAMTFSWFGIVTSSPLESIAYTLRTTFRELATGLLPSGAMTASSFFATPQAFTMATWLNIILSGTATLFLLIGILPMILKPKEKGVFAEYIDITVIAAIILVVSLFVPSIASILNFDRVYGITLLILSPCFVFGGLTLLTILRRVWTKIKRPMKRKIASRNKNIDFALLLIAIILGGYFLSQVGFVNRVTGGAIHTYTSDFDLMVKSNNIQAKTMLYWGYMSEQDVFSASWVSRHKVETAEVFADLLSTSHSLLSYGLIPNLLLMPITNTTMPPQGSLIYLGSLNTVNSVITTISGPFNTSEISFLLDKNNLVYANGDNQIWYVAPAN
jgi:uncharacterized membrane protein